MKRMKYGILRVFAAVIVLLSLESCVTNYVTATPATLEKGYKPDAKIAEVQKKIEADKQKLIASLQTETEVKIQLAAAKFKKEAISSALAAEAAVDYILHEADSYLGTPYRYGGMSRSGIDCSAFVLSVFDHAAGIQLPRVAASQSQEGESVERENLKKGDLLFFSQGGGRISHVAIVYEVTPEGEIKFIHSSSSHGVSYSSLDNSYWKKRFRFAKRILTADNLAMVQEKLKGLQASL